MSGRLSKRHDATGRTTGQRKNNSIDGPFAARIIEMLESPAYRVLSRAGHQVLSRIEVELFYHGGADNGKLPVTYQNFRDYGIHSDSIRPAIAEVEALGFIEVTQRGRGGNAEFRKPNLFRLTYRKTSVGNETHEWRRFKALKSAKAAAQRARQLFGKTEHRTRKPD